MNIKIVTILILWILVIDGTILHEDKSHTERSCLFNIEEGGQICTDIEYKSHADDYDITTICKTISVNNKGNSFNTSNSIGCNDVKIHLRTNAIGMPINFNGLILSSDKKSLEFIADTKYPTTLNNIFTRNQIEYNPDEWTISELSMSNGAEPPKKFNYDLLLWKANTNEESFEIKWKQINSIKMCISISYLLEDESKCTLSMNLSNGDIQIMSTYNLIESGKLKSVLFKNDYWLQENKTYSINFWLQRKSSQIQVYNDRYRKYYNDYNENKYIFKTIYAENCKIGIKRIAQCTDEYENEEILTINAKELQHTLPSDDSLTVDVYPFAYEPQKKFISLSSECFNGGFSNKNGCTCPPGFKGNNCEYGCGPNKFGTDCTGVCSIHQTQCRRMKFCTREFGCKCPAGYSGDDCGTECTSGTYGVNCEQQCSEGCRFKSCDVYTGICNRGCTTNYITPDCKEKYPWLKSPPQLESSDFMSLKLKINFNSENILGSSNVTSAYYQIVFKIASNESEFQSSELKEIGQQKSVIEIIDNLKPGTQYTFGVIIVLEDGNYNIEDNIKTVNYYTECQLPKKINYDVNLLSGIDYINVTWNKHNDLNENNCKITEYLLKLMYSNTSLEQLNYKEEVRSNNNYEHTFENLLPGEQYAVQIIAITVKGQAKESNISYIYTEPYGFVQIKNIKSKLNQNSSLTITWDVDESHANTPLNFEIKYKVNKHFSCSNEIITNNWTSLLVYNQTTGEIWDLIPNTQYVIKVDPLVKGYTYDDYTNMIFVKTPTSKPKLTPVINDENGLYTTNQSVHFSWKINKTECSKLNGFFRGYQIILKDNVEGTQVIKSIKENSVTINELKPENNYELQIYVLTNYGYNLEHGLLIPFKTKTKFLEPVDELIVYKKNLKRKSIGVRWSFHDENVINGFIVVVIDETSNNTKEIFKEPTRCVAWPTFYCTTIENLVPNSQYTIKIKAKSVNYPTGGSTASVVTNFNDGFADKPENLRAVDVGSTNITLVWDIPWILNGELKSFILNTEEISSQDIDKCCDSKPDVEIPVTEELPAYNCTINDLKPGSTYSIGVLSKTSTYGQTSRIHVTTLQSTLVAATDVIIEQPI